MDLRVSSLVVAIYVAIGVAVLGAISITVAYVSQNPRSTRELSLNGDTTERRGMRRRPTTGLERSLVSPEEHAQAIQRLKQLESLLERQTRLLHEKSALLEHKTAQYRSLEEELNGYLDLLTVMAAGESSDEQPSQDVAQTAQSEASRLRNQLTELTSRLAQTQTAEQQLEIELEELRVQLSQAYDVMAEQELNQLLESGPLVESAAATVLVQLGEPAIGPVTQLLTDERPAVRAWAATVLGQAGELAVGSLPALREATNDANPTVRQAALRALNEILD